MKTIDELIDSSWGPPKARVVCICGSVRFKKEMMGWACYWSKRSYVVVMPHCFEHDKFHDTKNRSAAKTKRQLDILYLSKIAMSEFVFVVDVGRYIGDSTAREIRFARKLNKPVKYASKIYPVPEEVKDAIHTSHPPWYKTHGLKGPPHQQTTDDERRKE